MKGLDDLTPKQTKKEVSSEDFQNTMVMTIEHMKKCQYCKPLGRALEAIEEVILNHMKTEALR